MRFSKEEIQEALCLRHTPEIQERLDRGRVPSRGLAASAPAWLWLLHGSVLDICI